jgi:MinD-like ATPase involved in chromosome partitioning or flagellar assembly
VVKRFLNRQLSYLGHVERDPHLSQSVRSQMLVTQCFPEAPSSRCFRRVAEALAMETAGAAPTDGRVWERLVNDWVN